MFWIEYRTATGTTQLSNAHGLLPGDLARAAASPEYVGEFQGDESGCETWGRTSCGRACGRGHAAKVAVSA